MAGLNLDIRKDVQLSRADNYTDAVNQALMSEQESREIVRDAQDKRPMYQVKSGRVRIKGGLYHNRWGNNWWYIQGSCSSNVILR